MEFLTEFSHVLLTSLLSVIVLFILTKLMGYRQLTQLSFFDYVIGITIGSIAAEMATDIENNWWKPLLAMVIYALAAILTAMLSLKSIKARRVLTGTPYILVYKGKIVRENMKKVRYDLNDLIADARMEGYFNLGDIDFAIMENNGKVSFLPKSETEPCTRKDANIAVSPSELCANVVIDGKIMVNALNAVGKNEVWLKEQLKSMNYTPTDLALAIYDGNKIVPFKYEKDNKSNDIFM